MAFGERALINDEPRAATVIAEEETHCLTVDREAFSRNLAKFEKKK